MSEHGTENWYTNHGCRCELCRAATRRYHHKRVWARMSTRKLVNGRLVAPRPSEYHGKASTYNNWGCRCDPCTAANRARQAEWRARP